MKTLMLALAFVAVLGMTGLADAKGTGKHGMRGKISGVSNGTLTLATHGKHGKKNAASATTTPTTQPSSLTVKFDDSTTITIDGVAGKLDSAATGKYASVLGSTNADGTVTATQITVTTAKPTHKKKAAA